MIASAVAFLVLLNPFALFIYLQPVMRELSTKDFLRVLFRASFISFMIFIIFALTGEFIFKKVLQINFEAFRLFGGIIFFSFAYIYIIHGKKSLIELKENLNDLASEIALPFMVGAATLSLSIIIGHKFSFAKTALILTFILLVNFAIIALLMGIRAAMSAKMKVAFDKTMEMALRLNGFFVGAIGLNMIITAIDNIYLS
jgi:multiple antibiotic resistance protein